MISPAVPEAKLNAALRRLDWRFLLRGPEAPRVADLRPWPQRIPLDLAFETVAADPAASDLVVLGYPRREALARAREILSPGGQAVCLWSMPAPGAARRARERLAGAGFADVRVYWPGPVPHRLPQFWLPLGSRAATDHLLAARPARSAAQRALRRLWRAAERAGALAPLCAIARVPVGPGDEGSQADPLGDIRPVTDSWMLLTAGRRSINKVVGLPFPADGKAPPPEVVKFARVPAAEEALGREADVLAALEARRPEVPGIPRLRARGRRAGRLGVAESAIHGRTLLSRLSPETFGELSARVTRWLIDLAGEAPSRPAAEWWPRLVGRPLDEFEGRFGEALDRDAGVRLRRLLEGIGDLPEVVEHRDCSPWNVILTGFGDPALLDWESAEPSGLPGLDLIYFLVNAAFILEGALESGRTREAYAGLLDEATEAGRLAAASLAEYADALRIDHETMRRLRLLCWVLHARSDYLHMEMEAAGPPSATDLARGTFLGLLEEDLKRLGARGG